MRRYGKEELARVQENIDSIKEKVKEDEKTLFLLARYKRFLIEKFELWKPISELIELLQSQKQNEQLIASVTLWFADGSSEYFYSSSTKAGHKFYCESNRVKVIENRNNTEVVFDCDIVGYTDLQLSENIGKE